jgi:hypothetical protein
MMRLVQTMTEAAGQAAQAAICRAMMSVPGGIVNANVTSGFRMMTDCLMHGRLDVPASADRLLGASPLDVGHRPVSLERSQAIDSVPPHR